MPIPIIQPDFVGLSEGISYEGIYITVTIEVTQGDSLTMITIV